MLFPTHWRDRAVLQAGGVDVNGVCLCVPLIQFTCEGSPRTALTVLLIGREGRHRKLSAALCLTVKCAIRIDTGRVSQLSFMLFSIQTQIRSHTVCVQHGCLGICRKPTIAEPILNYCALAV